MVCGAKIIGIEFRSMPSNKKKLWSTQWVIELEDIPEKAIETWNKGTAMVYVSDLRRERLRIKKYVKKNRNS